MSLTRIQYIYNFSPKYGSRTFIWFYETQRAKGFLLLFFFREYSEGRILDSQSHAHLSIEDLALIAASRMEVGGMTREIHGPALATAVEFQEAAYE